MQAKNGVSDSEEWLPLARNARHFGRTDTSDSFLSTAPSYTSQLPPNFAREPLEPSPQNDAELTTPRREFRGLPARRRSFRKTLLVVLARWLVMLALTCGTYAVLFIYSRKPVLDRKEKRVFNILITGLLIFLVLISVSIMNDTVLEMRWRILGRRYRSREKIDAILHCHSLRRVFMLAHGTKRATLHLAASAWILLAMTLQVGFASISLCFNVDAAEFRARLVPGAVAIADLSVVHTTKFVDSPDTLRARQYAANSYGTTSLAYDTATLNDVLGPGELFNYDDNVFFCETESQLCRFVFTEQDPTSIADPNRIPISATTDRFVDAQTTCTSQRVVSGGDGRVQLITVLEDSGEIRSVDLPVQGGLNQSTFMTDTAEECGPRCSFVTVFEAGLPDAWLYNCTTRFSPVTNAKLPQHEMGQNLTHMAASAIALQGFDSPIKSTLQAVVYPSQSVFGTPAAGDGATLAYLMSRFAIGVVGVVALNTQVVVVPGQTPHLGLTLNIEHWSVIHLILIGTTAALFIYAVAGAWFAHGVVIPESGSLAEAQILRPMMKKLDPVQEKDNKPKVFWTYRDQYVGNGVYDLYMEQRGPEVTSDKD